MSWQTNVEKDSEQETYDQVCDEAESLVEIKSSASASRPGRCWGQDRRHGEDARLKQEAGKTPGLSAACYHTEQSQQGAFNGALVLLFTLSGEHVTCAPL